MKKRQPKWRVAKSLDKLLGQLNEMFPDRSKASDGSIGDAAHASRASDHNPWVKDKNGVGVVTARDFTFDNDASDGVGIDCNWLADALVRSRDARIKYIIWAGKICSSYGFPAWAWREYRGRNPHRHHLHLSVVADERLFDDDSDWQLEARPPAPVTPEAPRELSVGMKGDDVSALQQRLHDLGYLKSSDIDGSFGRITRGAVFMFQQARGLEADGIVGAKTRKLLGL